LEAAFFDAEVVPLLSPGTANWRVLELGFGNGPFLGWCRGRPIDYYGVEIDPAMRERARTFGVAVPDSLFDSELATLAGSFDLIAAFDVIEHIEQDQLAAVFSQIEKLLKRGGHFIAQFPNGDSPFGRVNQHGDMTHVTTLGRGKIHHLASLSKLTVVSIADPKRPWKNVGLRNAARRMFGGLAKRVLEASIRTLYFGGESVCFDRNSVAVLRK
jgi:SAM-dependent methyltransferase